MINKGLVSPSCVKQAPKIVKIVKKWLLKAGDCLIEVYFYLFVLLGKLKPWSLKTSWLLNRGGVTLDIVN